MKKRYIIPLVVAMVLMMAAVVSADNCYGTYCCPYPTYCYPYNPQPVVRECASFVSDVTIPDGTYVAPGTTFIKTWRIRNNGTTTWTTKYKLVFVSGTQMASQSSVNLPYNVGPGQTVDISVQMTAPTASGSYKSSWMLVNESGTQFGVGSNCQTAVWAQIVNYVQTPNYYYCYPYNPCPQPCNPCPQPYNPCPQQPRYYEWFDPTADNFDRDADTNPVWNPGRPKPSWHW